ncbi:MAG: hydrogenase maturation protease [Isosphaeraceae bacterium]
MAASGNILIAGIGNIFLGDDGFGSDVARRLAERPLPDGVRVVDFGIRGLDLAYALSDGYDLMILIDATSQGGPAGTLYTFEPDLSNLPDQDDASAGMVDGHRMDPINLLRLARRIGEPCPRILLVGCEPADFGGEEGRMELSQPVQSAVTEACTLVESLVADFLQETTSISSVGRIVAAE